MLIFDDRECVQRPVLSPDGRLLAAITPDGGIQLINISEAVRGHRFVDRVRTPRSLRPFFKECSLVRWSPETVALTGPGDESDESPSNTPSQCEHGVTWLSLCDGKRLVALSIELRTSRTTPRFEDDGAEGSKSNILVDYSLGAQYGKVTLVEFVFSHRYALVMFEFGSSAVALSLTSPQREEIPHVKSPDASGLAVAPDGRYFALLRRDKGQDRVTVCRLGGDNRISPKSFDCHTLNAQNLTWCPSGDPVVAVWESPALGAKINFFTAQGHPLRQLDITSSSFSCNPGPTPRLEGLGVTHLTWKRAGRLHDGSSVQAFANGLKQVLVRSLATGSMNTRTLAQFVHPDLIDGSRTLVWQECSHNATDTSKSTSTTTTFTRQSGIFEAAHSTSPDARMHSNPDSQNPPTTTTQVDLIEVNSTHDTLATRLRGAHRTLFLWTPDDNNTSQPHPHTVLIFSHPIRQVHFHPFEHNVVVIITATTSTCPRVFAWSQDNDNNQPPMSCVIPIRVRASTDLSGSWLPECASTQGRCPFLFTTPTGFEVGYLSSDDGRLRFDSILHLRDDEDLNTTTTTTTTTTTAGSAEDSTTEIIDTPSRPSRRQQAGGGRQGDHY